MLLRCLQFRIWRAVFIGCLLPCHLSWAFSLPEEVKRVFHQECDILEKSLKSSQSLNQGRYLFFEDIVVHSKMIENRLDQIRSPSITQEEIYKIKQSFRNALMRNASWDKTFGYEKELLSLIRERTSDRINQGLIGRLACYHEKEQILDPSSMISFIENDLNSHLEKSLDVLSLIARKLHAQVIDTHELQIRVQDKTVPIYLTKKDDGRYEIYITHPDYKKVLVAGTQNTLLHCLHLSVYPEEKKGYLSQLIAPSARVPGVNCNFPEKEAGKTLLGIVDQVAEALQLKEMKLQDASALKCDKNHEFTNLTFLGIMTQGIGWYHKNGYHSENSNRYDQNATKLRGLSVSSLLKDVLKFGETVNSPQTREKIESSSHFRSYFYHYIANKDRFVSLMEAFLKDHPNGTLSELMTQTWDNKKGCESYILLKKMIFPSSWNSKFSENTARMDIPEFHWLPDFYQFNRDAEILKKIYPSR
jgi:hypothetical protein